METCHVDLSTPVPVNYWRLERRAARVTPTIRAGADDRNPVECSHAIHPKVAAQKRPHLGPWRRRPVVLKADRPFRSSLNLATLALGKMR